MMLEVTDVKIEPGGNREVKLVACGLQRRYDFFGPRNVTGVFDNGVTKKVIAFKNSDPDSHGGFLSL